MAWEDVPMDSQWEDVPMDAPAPKPVALVPKQPIAPQQPKPVVNGALGVGTAWPGVKGLADASRSASFNDPNKDASFMRDVVGQTGKDVLKSGANFIPSAINIPVNMAKTAVQGYKDIYNQGGEVLKSISDVGLGQSAKSLGQSLLDGIADPIKSRYGSAEAIRNTAITDPAGMLLDESALVGGVGVGAGLAGKGAGMAGKANAASRLADVSNVLKGGAKELAKTPINAPLKVAQKVMPKSWPDKLLSSADKAPLSKDWIKSTLSEENGTELVSKRKNVIATQKAEKILPTEAGALKTNKLMNETGKQIGDIVDKHTTDGKTLDFNSALENARQAMYNNKAVKSASDKAAARATIDGIIEGYKQHGDTITPREMQDIKTNVYQNFDKQSANWNGHGPLAEQTLKAVANQAKLSLEALDPSLKPLNSRYGSLADLKPVIDKAMGREMNKDVIGLSDRVVGAGVGAATGNFPKVAAAGAGLASKVIGANKARAAFALDNLSKWDKTPMNWPKTPELPAVAPATAPAIPAKAIHPEAQFQQWLRESLLKDQPMTFDPTAHIAPQVPSGGRSFAVNPIDARDAAIRAADIPGMEPGKTWPIVQTPKPGILNRTGATADELLNQEFSGVPVTRGKGLPEPLTPSNGKSLVKANGEPMATAKAELPSIDKADLPEQDVYYRAVKADKPLSETSDHWYNTTPEAAEATRASLESSNQGAPYKVIKVSGEAVRKAGIVLAKDSPFADRGVPGQWIQTKEFVDHSNVIQDTPSIFDRPGRPKKKK